MKRTIFAYILFVYCFISCTNNQDSGDLPVSTSINKILTLGDSRVEGHTPFHESYRYELWKNLLGTGIEFDLIGPFKDAGNYPQVNNLTFDADHAGIGGDTTIGIIERYQQSLSTGIPDIVLLGIGGNDIVGGRSITEVISSLSQILDLIYASNPEAIVFVELIAGANPTSDGAQQLNSLVTVFESELRQLTTMKTRDNFRVIPVDMNTNFTNNPNYYADNVHYSALGAKEIAQRYFTAIKPYLQ